MEGFCHGTVHLPHIKVEFSRLNGVALAANDDFLVNLVIL